MSFKTKFDRILKDNRLNIRNVTAASEYINVDRHTLARYYRLDKEPPLNITKKILFGFDLSGRWYYEGIGPMFTNERPEDLLRRQIQLLEENKALLQKQFDEQSMKILALEADLHLWEQKEMEHTLNTKYL